MLSSLRLAACVAAATLVCAPGFASTLSVNSKALDGSNAAQMVTYTAASSGTYRVTASGYYQYDYPHDADSYADAGWATWDGWTTVRHKFDGTPVQDQPGGATYPTPPGILMLWANDGSTDFHEWGAYSASHIYSHDFTLAAGQQLTFWISDWTPYDATNYGRPVREYYLDNVGALTVDVSAVPEPCAGAALMTGLVGFMGVLFRKNK